ncbi:MAG: S8 family serine peptidase [Candidatus Eisenbacteria bacterium]
MKNLTSRMALLLLLPLALPMGSAARAEGMDTTHGERSLSRPLPVSREAARKLDPRLLLTLATPEKNARTLAPLGRQIRLLGDSFEEIRYPVLIRTSLSDAELAALGAEPDSRVGDIVTAVVTAETLELLGSDPGIDAVEASYRMEANLDVSVPEVRANLVNGAGGYTGRGVLFGLLDDGIDLTHDDFKDGQGKTRALYVWDQWIDGAPPAGFGYGTEYSKSQIDAGQATSFIDFGGHGAHVAGIAVGDGSSTPTLKYRGVAWEADILAVRNGWCDMFCYGGGMPPYGPQDTKGSIDALQWFLQKRDQLGKPLVVNQSQGTMMGPHDGTTLFETAYNQMIQNDNLIVCVASGNDQDEAWHGRADVSPGGQGTFVIQHDVSQGARGMVFFECWYDQGDAFRWQVQTPSGATIDVPSSIPLDQYPGTRTAHSDSVFYWTTTSSAVNGQGYASYIIQNRTNGVEGGNWTIRAIAENALPSGGVVDLFCERNQPNIRVTTGANDEAIVGMPGSCSGVITVGSYNTKLEWDGLDGHYQALNENEVGDISSFSSWGPLRHGAAKPDLSAPGAWIMSVFAAGSDNEPATTDPTQKYVIMPGTSMATPHVAGAIALMLQKDPTLTPSQVKTILQDTARSDNWTGTTPNRKFGAGKLDVKAAVDAVGGGGPPQCATRSGDATADNSVNVLDVVATVNDILQLQPLGEGPRACADVDGNGSINILDVVAIVNIILNGGEPGRPADGALAASEGPSTPIAWGEGVNEDSYRFTLRAGDIAGVEMSFIPARGFEVAGDPAVRGAGANVRVAHVSRLGQEKLVVYALAGAIAAGQEPVTIEVPLVRRWGSHDATESRMTGLLLAGRTGRAVALEERPSLEVPASQPPVSTAFQATIGPNPMRAAADVRYAIPRNGDVEISIFDAAGRRVRSLWNGWQMAGGHTIGWDGKDDLGRAVPGGVYFVRISSDRETANEKVLLVR